MDDLIKRLEETRQHVDVAADDASLARAWERLGARRRRRAVGRAASGVVLAAAAVALIALQMKAPSPAAPSAMTDPPVATPPDLQLPEGSRVYFLGPDAEVGTTRVSATHIRLTLVAGGARFEVSRRPERTFEVSAAGVSVEVVGTVFEVRRVDASRVEVAVIEGRVRVRSAEGDVFLGPDERGTYASEIAPDDAANDATSAQQPRPNETAARPSEAVARPNEATARAGTADLRARPPSATPTPAVDWRALAAEGQYDSAWAALERSDDLREEDAGDLLLAADTARLSGHPDRARQLLRRVVEAHTDDPRANLAAFTLGRMLLRGQPAAAAEAFAISRRLDPTSALAQDALGREVEAWHHAGQSDRARAAALEYMARWPTGPRVDAVRTWGGL